MRYCTDPQHELFVHPSLATFEVTLDGQFFDKGPLFFADDGAGVVVYYVLNAAGHITFDRSTGCFDTNAAWGEVHIYRLPATPTHH